jgi:hypothetical protein
MTAESRQAQAIYVIAEAVPFVGLSLSQAVGVYERSCAVQIGGKI